MDRADARRGARIDRINATQSPYGNRERRRKKQKPQKGGLWSFIKSWSFFGHDEDANMDGDSDSDDDMLGVQPTGFFPNFATERYFFFKPNRIEEEAQAALAASAPPPAPTYIPDDDDLRAYRMPGGLGRSPTPVWKPEPIAPPVAKYTIHGADGKIIAKMGPQTPPRPSSPQAGSSTIGAVRTMVSAQVAKFLLNKGGKPLTSKEFEQIDKMLRYAVDKDAPKGDLSIFTSDPIISEALQLAESTDEPAEQPYMGTVITSIPPGETFDEIIPQTFGLKPASETKEKSSEKGDKKIDEKVDESASTSGTERYSPAPSFGLPEFEPPADPNRPPSPEPEFTPEEIAAEEKLRVELEDRAEHLRKFLHLDDEDNEHIDAWDELERWKGLKSPTSSATGSDITTSAGSSSGTSRGDEDEDDHMKLPDDLFDYNKGYTPAELMVNPYDRLSAFKNRKVRRKLVSLEDLQAMRKKRAVAKKEAAKKEAARLKAETEKMDEEEESLSEPEGPRTPLPRNAGYSRPDVPIPPMPARREITMGMLNAAVSKRDFICASFYHEEPTEERPLLGDWITSGTTKDGQKYEKAVKRKAVTLYMEVNGMLLDPPVEGPPMKRRRSSGPPDANLKNAIFLDVGLDPPAAEENVEAEEEEEDNEEMVDETPERPSLPPIVLTRASPARKKPRPKIRPVPDASRPKHFQYSPVTPSPLRMVSAFDSPKDSPKQASVEIPPEAVPPTKEAPVKDEESYHFATYVYRLGSIGPMRTSKEMFKANQRAFGYSPYLLPEYKMGSGKYRARYSRGIKRKTPKTFRKKKNAKNPHVDPDTQGFEVGFEEPIPAKPRNFQPQPTKPSAAKPTPATPVVTSEPEPRKEVPRATVKPTEPTTIKPAEPTRATNGTESTSPTAHTNATKPAKPTNGTGSTRPTAHTNATKSAEPTKGTDGTESIRPTAHTNVTKPTNDTNLTNGIKLTNGTKPTDATEVSNGSAIPNVKIVNGMPKPVEESSTTPAPDFLKPPRRINYLAAMVPELRHASHPYRRKPATSTPSSEPLIHSLSKATNPMPDDIPPLRLPELPAPTPAPAPARASRPTRAPRLRPGPTAAMRGYEWAAAGIRPIETTIRSPNFDLLSLPPITNSLGIWSCNNCMIGNSPGVERCHCCGRYADGRVPTSKYGGFVPRAIAV